MSFDLYVFDMDLVPDDEEELCEMLEDDSRWGGRPTPRLAAFIAELNSSFPGLDIDPDGSPWATWPLEQTMVEGHCVGFDIVWSHAESMIREFTARCDASNLILYDPQMSEVIRPSGSSGR